MTISEKILSEHAGKPSRAGEIVLCSIDHIMMHDANGPLAVRAFEQMSGIKVFDAERVSIVFDHCSPAPNEKTSNLQLSLSEFAKKQGVRVFDWGRGVCHQLMIESGLVKEGDLVLGTDSHTCSYGALGAFATGVGATDIAAALITGKSWFRVPETIKIVLTGKLQPGCSAKDIILTLIGRIGAAGGNYKAFEFYGQYVAECATADRITIANMVVEMGGKNCFLCTNQMKIAADPDAEYEKTIELGLEEVVPCVAKPHAVDNYAPVHEVAGQAFQYAFLGSCTNGRIEDLRAAESILRGKAVAEGVRLLIVPASEKVLLQAMEEGIAQSLMRAGGVFFTPGCAACVGTHGGVPRNGEKVLSTANRNFYGRMGNKQSEIFLSSPITLAVSCLHGRITDPREYFAEVSI